MKDFGKKILEVPNQLYREIIKEKKYFKQAKVANKNAKLENFQN